jgi:hypothetical protein
MSKTMKAVGSKAQVWHGTAKHTSGGLTKGDLMKTKKGRIVSRRKHNIGKRAIKHLHELGFKPKKGTFKLFHGKASAHRKSRRRTRRVGRRHGGSAPGAIKAMTDMLSQLQPKA